MRERTPGAGGGPSLYQRLCVACCLLASACWALTVAVKRAAVVFSLLGICMLFAAGIFIGLANSAAHRR